MTSSQSDFKDCIKFFDACKVKSLFLYLSVVGEANGFYCYPSLLSRCRIMQRL